MEYLLVRDCSIVWWSIGLDRAASMVSGWRIGDMLCCVVEYQWGLVSTEIIYICQNTKLLGSRCHTCHVVKPPGYDILKG